MRNNASRRRWRHKLASARSVKPRGLKTGGLGKVLVVVKRNS